MTVTCIASYSGVREEHPSGLLTAFARSQVQSVPFSPPHLHISLLLPHHPPHSPSRSPFFFVLSPPPLPLTSALTLTPSPPSSPRGHRRRKNSVTGSPFAAWAPEGTGAEFTSFYYR